MTEGPGSSAQRVQSTLRALGFDCEVVELAQTTRTAAEAAAAIGCQVGQIAKSLVFRGKQSHRPILVIASGPNRVSEANLGELVGEAAERPDADYVRQRTGFAIGGVPPVGHLETLLTFVDEDLLRYEDIWAAAGNPHTVFKLSPSNLVRMTGGQVVAVK